MLMWGRYILFLLIGVTYSSALVAQKNLPVLNTSEKELFIQIKDASTEGVRHWLPLPNVANDVYYTSALQDTVRFISTIDTLAFFIERNREHHFYIKTLDGNLAYTTIKYIEMVGTDLTLQDIQESLEELPQQYTKNTKDSAKNGGLKVNDEIKFINRNTNEIIYEATFEGALDQKINIPKEFAEDPEEYEVVYAKHKRDRPVVMFYSKEKPGERDSAQEQNYEDTVFEEFLIGKLIPFDFKITSEPPQAKLFAIPIGAWVLFQHTNDYAKEFVVGQTYFLNRLQMGQDFIHFLNENHANKTGELTDTTIKTIETPYIIILQIDNAIHIDRIEPIRGADNNHKIIRFNTRRHD